MGKNSSKMQAVQGLEAQWFQVQAALEDALPTVGKNFAAAREAALGADPMLKSLFEQIFAGIEGDVSELPPDMQQNILKDVRGGQASRGVLESDTSAVEEAVSLLGGREQLRSRRLAQAGQLLSSGLLPKASDFLPSATDFLSAALSLEDLRLQRNLGKKGIGAQKRGQTLGFEASIIDSYASSISGGGGSSSLLY